MQYETMKSRILSAPILINNFVKGIGPYTYEQYLIEVVNSTPYFLQKSKGALYTHPEKEDHSEWDCVSSEYAMDFKLIASKSRLHALSLFSSQIYVNNGIISYCAPRMQPSDKGYKPISATRIFAALRALNYNDGRLSSEVQHILEERLIRSEPTKAFAGSEVEQSTEGGEISLRDIVQGMAFRNKLPEQPVCVLDRRLFPGRMRMRKVDQYSEFLLHLLALNEFSALVKGNSFNLFAGTLEHSHQLFSDGSGVQPLHFAGQQKPATPVGGGHNGCRAFRAHNRVRFEISDSCAFVRFLRPIRDGTTKADLVSFVRLADLFVFNSQIDPQGIAQEPVIQRPVNRRGADAVPLLILQAIGDLFRRPEQMPQQKTDLIA